MRAPCFLLILLALTAFAQSQVVGIPSVIDGDSLEIRGVKVRLYGIDAPEMGQTCTDARGLRYRCGARAANELAAFIARRTVTCTRRSTDRHGRMVAVCFLGRTNLNEWVVRQGWALAFVRYSTAYVAAQRQAVANRRGLHQGSFEAPWDWRNRGSSTTPQRPQSPSKEVYYRSCSEARAAGAAPLRMGQPGYRPGLDRDKDGIACE
jgi:endonuclease YncB( thermonuclease family)